MRLNRIPYPLLPRSSQTRTLSNIYAKTFRISPSGSGERGFEPGVAVSWHADGDRAAKHAWRAQVTTPANFADGCRLNCRASAN